MPTQFTDAQIQALILEAKELPEDYRARMTMKPKPGHKEAELSVQGANGNTFLLILRENLIDPMGFSVILAYKIPNSSQPFRLRRYNGKHQHTNKIERETIYGFHIHTATERYQRSGLREDAYAVLTDKYADFSGAFTCMLEECGFVVEPTPQTRMFDTEFMQ